MRPRSWSALTFGLFGLALTSGLPVAAQTLGPFNVPKSRIFVAGISSGGYMAVQMHVAYSGLFKGAAVYAGGPDYCAQDSLELALTTCLANVPPVNAAALVATTRSWAQQGLIDPVTNLQGQPIYLWSGVLDTTVRQPLMDALRDYYGALGATVFRYDNSFLAAHGWESPYGPQPCGNAASPYVINCYGYDKSGATYTDPGYAALYDSEQVWLTRWLGPLNPKNTGTLQGSVVPFDQSRFVPGGNDVAISMDRIGYAFVPADCAAGRSCSLVLALHGCKQSYSAVGPAFINDAGINQWADTNHIVVLYPQVIATSSTGSNPQGCWNWWGYLNDPDYALKSGPQMQTLYRMVAQAAGRSVAPYP